MENSVDLSADTLDDLLKDVYDLLLGRGHRNEGASRGPNIEIFGCVLRLLNPLNRLSRSESRGKVYSPIGELLWYLSGQNNLEFIERYVPAYRKDAEEDGTIHGAYGPRLLSHRGEINQIESVINLLTIKPSTRRAVIQLFDAADLCGTYKEIPCTTSLQFFIREQKLYLCACMRSNDAFLGLPHDVFCFTMIQEFVARKLGVELGQYIHMVGSLHIYEKHKGQAVSYINEGYQRTLGMPPMPDGDNFEKIHELLSVEKFLRENKRVNFRDHFFEDYWIDICLLLESFLSADKERIAQIRAEISHDPFRTYLDARRAIKAKNDLEAS